MASQTPVLNLGSLTPEQLRQGFEDGHLKLYRGFAQEITRRIRVTSVELREKEEEPSRQEARVVCEVDVIDDMLNPLDNVHGGCMATIVDVCTSLPLSVWSLALGGRGLSGVSQSISVWYHAPAPKGTTLRIISTTTAVGSRVMSVKCEVWDIINRRLCATAVHSKLDPSPVKAKL